MSLIGNIWCVWTDRLRLAICHYTHLVLDFLPLVWIDLSWDLSVETNRLRADSNLHSPYLMSFHPDLEPCLKRLARMITLMVVYVWLLASLHWLFYILIARNLINCTPFFSLLHWNHKRYHDSHQWFKYLSLSCNMMTATILKLTFTK